MSFLMLRTSALCCGAWRNLECSSSCCVVRRSTANFICIFTTHLRKLSETIGVEHISLIVLQNTFIARWVQSGRSLDALCLISGLGPYHWRFNFHLISEHKLAIAVREQAQFEEEL